jgi:hypothetical protein
MSKVEHDIVAILAADIASPRVLTRIDSALETIEQQRGELLNLRKTAVRLHGEQPLSPEASISSSETKEVASEQPTQAHPTSSGGSIASLIAAYKADPDSPFQKVRFRTRGHYESVCRRIDGDYGDVLIKDINARTLLQWHEDWSGAGRVAMAHALIGMVRMLFSYGASILEDPECQRLCGVLNKMRFKMAKPRTEQFTEEHANAIRKAAHGARLPSIALIQAIQFECKLGQKDVIGDWVPLSEPGDSSVVEGDTKWLQGIRWEQIDDHLVLRHTTSREGNQVTFDLRRLPMVMAELTAAYGNQGSLNRTQLPLSGPMIVEERTGSPYRQHQFRAIWRKLADTAGLPKTVRNMDSRPRSGAGIRKSAVFA